MVWERQEGGRLFGAIGSWKGSHWRVDQSDIIWLRIQPEGRAKSEAERRIVGISIFQDAKEVQDIGEYGLRIASIGVIFLPISVTVNMLYQSIRKSNIASFLALLRSGLVFIPVLILFANIWDLNGILWAQPIADIIASLISIPFIIHFLFKTPNTTKKDEENIEA